MNADEAERWLLGLELHGMRFGLDRMHRLMGVLGHPERSFESIHVVGTNGKSSTTRMIAAIIAHHGRQVGSYLSPHLLSYRERIRLGDSDLAPDPFAAAIERARDAAEEVNAGRAADDQVTQFELLTAAAFSEFAQIGVGAAVVEAGLGGRYDATNVIPSRVQVLTNVGLEHTRLLGSTVIAIAREKVEIVKPGGTLVLGAGMHPDAVAVAEEVAGERGVRIVQAPADAGVQLGALGAYQRRNFALARAAADAFLGALDADAVSAAAAGTLVPGRLQVIGEEPLTLVDSAHNPDGIAALAESLPEFARGRRVVAVVSILNDKDAVTMLSELAPLCESIVLTASQNPRALPPPALADQAAAIAGPRFETIADADAALARGRELAGPDGVVVVTGSIYLIGDLLAHRAGAVRRPSTL